MIPEPLPDVRQLLAFYLEAGVDCALADEPINRLVEPEAAPAPAAAVARPAAASP
ncbi:MAG: uracil-DNA glycosylase, partial [Bradyrhizobium sp.]|nr:uracil-DNA glycosylase [Bradyrhizobium sp.]MDU6375184.1 uracil-DNA glycosylase [Bradyrhizobium sp.]